MPTIPLLISIPPAKAHTAAATNNRDRFEILGTNLSIEN